MEPLGGNRSSDQRESPILRWIAVLIPGFVILTGGGLLLYLNSGSSFEKKGSFDSILQYEEFKCSMSELQKNEQAIDFLGTPIRNGSDIEPATEILGSDRRVNFRVSVSGPNASGKLTVISHRSSFQSNFLVYLEAEGKKITVHSGSYPCDNDTHGKVKF